MSTIKTILVAEPTKSLVTELGLFMTERGVNTVHSKTLQETLLTLQGQRIDALVLDAELLREDLGFISIIKGIEENLPIIVCAETNTPEFESRIRQHRIFFYHIKSFGTQDLETAILNALGKRQN